MRKKIILLLLFIFTLCGCQNIYEDSIDNILSGINEKRVPNTIRSGYNYYLPSSMQIKEYSLYNDVIESEKYTYYLYVDMISYLNHVELNFEESENAYYYSLLGDEEKFGYVQITLEENDKYLIEIMYNYAKILLMVDKEDINLSLDYCVSILSSIEYNDSIIENLIGENLLNYEETVFDPFKEVNESSNYMKRVSEENTLEGEATDEDMIS